jgi:hypothetical protein
VVSDASRAIPWLGLPTTGTSLSTYVHGVSHDEFVKAKPSPFSEERVLIRGTYLLP